MVRSIEKLAYRALALEGMLSRRDLARIVNDEARLDRWLEEATSTGTVCRFEPTAAVAYHGSSEARFGLPADVQQRELRELARAGGLDEMTRQTETALRERSVAAMNSALQRGDLVGFERRAQRARKLSISTEGASLRTAVCAAFDPDWLVSTFGDGTSVVVARALNESLHPLHECNALYAWAASSTWSEESVLTAIAGHAVLRGEQSDQARLAGDLDGPAAVVVRVAELFQRGDLVAAKAQLVRLTRKTAKRDLVQAAAPIAALLMLEEGGPGAAAARRLIAREPKETTRAFRHLLTALERPESLPRRLDAARVGTGLAWETLLSALAVHVASDRKPVRASWATHLVRQAQAWDAMGYRWLSKQARLLADELDSAYAVAELERLGDDGSALLTAPRELRLWDRVSPKPPWKRALESLDRLTTELASRAESAFRAAWFVDMASQALTRPALQRYDPERGGWTTGRRVDVDELAAQAEQLPWEDQAVLATLHRSGAESPAVFEALIGHPRVYGGGHRMDRIEIARGHCRVETRDEPRGTRIVVEPRDAAVGVHVVRDGPRRLLIYRVDEAFHKVREALPVGVLIPRHEEQALVQILGQLAAAVPVHSPHIGAEREVQADVTPCIRIAPQAGGFYAQIGVRPFGADGRFFSPGGGPRALSSIVRGSRLRTTRDFELERERSRELVQACATLVDQAEGDVDLVEQGWFLGEEGVLELLSDLRRAAIVHHVEWRGPKGIALVGTVTRSSLRGRMRCIKGWYVADGEVALDGFLEEALEDVCRAPILGDGRFVRMADGQYAEVEASLRRTMATLRAAARRSGSLRLAPAALGPLRALHDSGAFSFDDESRAWLDRAAHARTVTYSVPSCIEAELRGYQIEGFRWMRALCALGIGPCLADDMGLGKTLQIIVLLASLDPGPKLVVAPTSVCGNWEAELRTFAPTLAVQAYEGADRRLPADGDDAIVITSYALLAQDVDALKSVSWRAVVLDEAQFIKNPSSRRAKAAYALRAEHRIVATGTPVENHLGDLWAIFHFLNRGLLSDWSHFRARFVHPIEREGSEAAKAALRVLLGGYVLRRTKGDVLAELPPVTHVVYDVALGEETSVLYAALRSQIKHKLRAGRRHNHIDALAEITRLRRFCCHPKLVFPDREVASPKIEALLDLVLELREGGHRALVFSQFVDVLSLVRERFDEAGIRYSYLDGSTPARERQARVAAFQEGTDDAFLISLKAGGFGLNLTGADYVVLMDPWWNPAVEMQASDRAHRIGQTRPVTVYRLLAKHTIEERIAALQREKRTLASAVLDGGEIAAKLPLEDLMALLEVGV